MGNEEVPHARRPPQGYASPGWCRPLTRPDGEAAEGRGSEGLKKMVIPTGCAALWPVTGHKGAHHDPSHPQDPVRGR